MTSVFGAPPQTLLISLSILQYLAISTLLRPLASLAIFKSQVSHSADITVVLDRGDHHAGDDRNETMLRRDAGRAIARLLLDRTVPRGLSCDTRAVPSMR